MTERRALVLALALLGGLARTVQAAEGATTGAVMIYADDDHVTVVAPSVGGRYALERLTVDARYTVDAVTAASVDLVTAASPGGFSELRHQASGHAEYALWPGVRVDGGYGASVEPDFVGHGLDGGGHVELFDRRSTLEAHYSFRYANVMRAHDAAFERTRTEHDGEITWGQVLGPRLVLDVAGSVDHARGFLANPYRVVRIYAPGAPEAVTAVVEAVPETRTSGALTARVRARPGERLRTLLEYRLVRDTWGVTAHTGTARAMLSLLEERLLLSIEARGYAQGRADFYRKRYETFPEAPLYRTGDKELGRLWTVLGGVDAEWSVALAHGRMLRLGLGFDLYHLRYPDHPVLHARTAGIWTADVTWEL